MHPHCATWHILEPLMACQMQWLVATKRGLSMLILAGAPVPLMKTLVEFLCAVEVSSTFGKTNSNLERYS